MYLKKLLILVLILVGNEMLAQVQFYGVSEKLLEINSSFDENFLSISPDGAVLVVTRRNHPDNIGEIYNPADMWVSYFGEEWTSPDRTFNVQPEQYNVPFGFVNDNALFIYGASERNVNSYSSSLWVADHQEGHLINHRKLKIPYFKNKSEHLAGAISADGRHIVLSMEGTTSFGVEDIYVIHLLQDGTWSAPKNLGYRVNTAFQEFSPFLAADNETLIFATNGRGGQGSFDLFVTQRIDETWQNWTEPENLGTAVNTEGAETSLVFAPGAENAYFVSTTDSDGYGDVRSIAIKNDIGPAADTVTEFDLKVDPDEVRRIFSLKDMNSDQIIDGEIKIETITEDWVDTPFEMKTTELTDISLIAKSPGYLEFEAVITASELKAQDLIVIPMKALEVGATINLENVLFYQGTANFIEGSEKELDRVVDMMIQNPGMRIMIKGHTDNVGNPALNLELSRERVRVVMEYLGSKGIDPVRLEGKGFGGSQPIAENDSEDNRKLNRRVEFTILENQ